MRVDVRGVVAAALLVAIGACGKVNEPGDPDANEGGPDAAVTIDAAESADAAPPDASIAPDANTSVPNLTLLQGTSQLGSTATWDFGTVWTNQSSAEVVFTVRNTGTADLFLASVTMSSQSDFALTAAVPGSVIPAGLEVTFGVVFHPSAIGARSATVTLVSDDPDQTNVVLMLTGTGSAPDVVVVTQSTPTGGAVGVRVDSDIRIVFDKDLDPATISGTSIQAPGAIAHTANYLVATRTLVLTPNADLPPTRAITVTLPATIEGASDEVFAGHNFNFNTGTAWHDGNTVFVSATGSAGAPGTLAQPLRSVQAGVDLAVSRSLTQVFVTEGSFTFSNGGLGPSGTATLTLANPMTVRGGWNTTFTTVLGTSTFDAEAMSDHVIWISASNVTVRDVVARRGNADGVFPHDHGGGVLIRGSAAISGIALEKVTVESCSAAEEGGGIAVLGGASNVTINDGTVQNNTAPNRGGGIRLSGVSNITVSATRIEGNSGFVGGLSAIGVSDVTLNNLFVRDNNGSSGADAIEFWEGTNVTIRGSHIEGTPYGIMLNGNTGSNMPNLVIDNNQFSSPTFGNTTAIAIFEGQAAISGHTITNNRFLTNYLGFLYRNSTGTQTADDAAGLAVLNTANSAAHGAATASGNTLTQ